MSDTEINKENAIKLIAGRIFNEHKKHSSQIEVWHEIAAAKIYNQWFEFFQSERDSLKEQLENTKRENDNLYEVKIAYQEKVQSLQSDLAASQSLVEELKKENDEMRVENNALDKLCSVRDKMILNYKEENTVLEAKCNGLEFKVTELVSKNSELKSQADMMEGALDNLTSKVNHVLNTSNITEQQDRFNHLIDAYNRSFEALNNYKQSK